MLILCTECGHDRPRDMFVSATLEIDMPICDLCFDGVDPEWKIEELGMDPEDTIPAGATEKDRTKTDGRQTNERSESAPQRPDGDHCQQGD